MEKIFAVDTKSLTYALGVDDLGRLHHIYWGKRINRDDFEIPQLWDCNSNHSDLDCAKQEYTAFGGKMYRNCAFKCTYGDGCRDSVFTYKDCDEGENELVIVLEDKAYNAEIRLHYIHYPDSDIITRYAEIFNNGAENIVIDKMMSCELNLPGLEPYYIENTNGSWGGEFQVKATKLETGYLVFDSRKGTTSHTNQPTFVAHRGANEDCGTVYFAALGYSGSFKVEAQCDFDGRTRVMLGINDFDFSYTLKPGESLASPKVYIGCADGFAQMSNSMSAFEIKHILPKGFADKPLPVLYNSWEATGFDVNTQNQLSLAKKAKEIGCELFVMDDGWFGKRNDDRAGLGDWTVNTDKFPNGIDELIDGVNALGMDFGLWFEPEMVQRDSDLYRAHPDWIYSYPKRKSSELRNQLVLNLTKPEVEEYAFGVMDDMLKNHNIRYIKWDMNRPFSEIGADNLENPQELWLRHTQAVYRIADRLKQKYPYLQLEACSSGGGRADLGAMEHFDMVWTSDNTDPVDRLDIQYGFSRLYPVKCMRAWVTDWNSDKRPVSLDYRFNSSMQGSLSVGANLDALSHEDLEKCREYISLYKEIRSTVQLGRLYRLKNAEQNGYFATMYTDDSSAVVFVCETGQAPFNKRLHELCLRGLDENASYAFCIDGREYVKSGAYLMNKGICIDMWNPLGNKIIQLKKLTK
ncbi:alpha-galactosidase [Eubacterium sp.]|uniref:alpha-galactosidase n=1 Tax=Eubacterium sp. TaxID=142586 RepID=UPI003EFE4A52